MKKTSKKDGPEGDPKRGDEILRTMLKMKPKTHEEMTKKARPKKAGK